MQFKDQFIDWHTLEFKKTSGKEKIRCPKCHDQRSDKKDKSLQINHKEGYGKCHYCHALTFRENKQTISKEFKLPVQTWRNYTSLSDKMVKFLESRKISQHTAIALGWTEEKYYQPRKKGKVNNLVFNFFEADVLVNKKYRTADKCFTQSSDAKSILYNINAAIDQETLYITEGEFDVAALYEVGIKNAVSVPNGANDNDDYWKNSKKHLEHIKKFIIAVDNDEKGNDLREKIAQRLGRWRCEFIIWKGKDANDDLMSGDLERTLKKPNKFPVNGTFKISDLIDGVYDYYDNGLPETIYPKHPCFGKLKDIFSVMRGQLTVGTGIPSHSKSTFTDWLVLNLIQDYGMKASWFSPEHNPMDLYQTSLIEKVTGKSFWPKKNGQSVPRVTKKEIERYKEWAEEKIYLTNCTENDFPTWSWLLDKFKEQMYAYGIDIFIIDAFNKVVMPPGNKLDEINKILTKLTSFAQVNNVIMFLIAHPTKMKKNDQGIYDCPTLYDVSGSSDFRNQTHNGYTIYRHFANEVTGEEDHIDFINMKTKFPFQGKMGELVKFKYHNVNGRFYANNVLPDFSLIDPEPLPKNTLQDAFGDVANVNELHF
ncbi:MAG: bifunctional DNA primase/helicase [bacterium]